MPPWPPRLQSNPNLSNPRAPTIAPHNRPAQSDAIVQPGPSLHTNLANSPQPNSHQEREYVSNSSGHGRSRSHPFPTLFSPGKKNASSSRRGTHLEHFDGDTTDDDGIPPAVEGRQRPSDKDMAKGKCMTCDAPVKWPKTLKHFRCTICMTVNDVQPFEENDNLASTPFRPVGQRGAIKQWLII
jgi:E3 ubiquitin-protein ligase HECTD2